MNSCLAAEPKGDRHKETMRRGRQPGRSSANDGAVAGSSRDREEQWEPQPSTSQAGGDDSADDDAASSDGGGDYRLMSPRPSSATGYSPSGGYGSSSPAGVGSEAEPHRTWPMLSGRRAGGGGSGDASPSGSDLLCPPDLQAMPLSPLPGPSGVQDPMAQPVYQADTAGVLLRSPPADSYLVSSSTGPLDGPASVRSDAPPPTPGMSAMIDSTVDDAESTRGAHHLDGSESDDEPDDGISSGSAGRLNLASTAAPDPADDPSEPASLAAHSPEPGPSGLAAGRSVDPGGGRRAEAGGSGGAQLPVVTAGHHLVTDSVIMAPVHERYEPDTGGSALVIYDYLEELPADGGDPSDSALESPPSSARLARHGEPAEAAEEECVSHEAGEDGGMAEGALRLAPDEREALRRERSESRLGSRSRRPEPPLLRLPRTRQRSHQHHQPHHQPAAQDELGRHHGDDDEDDDEANHHRDHLLSAERPDLLVPLPPDSDSEPEPGDGSGGERGMLAMACDGDAMACDGDETLLPLDGGQEGLFEREAALSDVDSEDGVDGHAVILADEGQYRLSETDEEPDTVEPVMHVQAEEPESGGPSAHPEDGEAAGAGGVSGLRPADLSQLPFIYLTDGLDIGLDAEDGSGDASGREPGASHLLVQVPPAYERQQAHQNDFWCEECCAYYRGRCPDHQVRLISDRPMQSRAWASLPTSHLAIRAVGTAADPTGETVYGVTAKKTIPKRTQFGPMEGILVKRDRGVIPANPSGLVLSVDNGGQLHTVDVSNPDCSNWMRFVRRAETPEQQNLVLNQQGSHLFLTSSRAIEPREELRAGYSLPYAARRGLAMLVAKPDGAADLTPCGDGTAEDGGAAGPVSGGGEEGMDVVDPTEQAQPEQEEPDGPDDPDDPDWPLTCDRCGRCFVNLSAVERHDCDAPEEEGEEGVAEDEEDGEEEEEEEVEQPSRRRPPQRRGRGRPVKARQTTARQTDKATANRWLCQYCPLSFESASTLNLHTLAHAAQDLEDSTLAAGEDGEEDGVLGGLAPDQPLDCPECNKEFLDKDELISHVASHGTEAVAMEEVEDVPTDESRPYKCHPCQRTFTHEEWLKRHLQSHVPDEEKPLVCGTCERRFVTTAALQCHRRVHSAAARRFQCPLCRAMFEQVTSLKEHVRTHATDGKYVCPHCGKSFDGYMTIRKHIRSFHNERVFVCSLCYKLCQSTDKLKQHMLKHSDHREFLCSECGKQFKRKDKLKEHVKRIHSLEKKVATERKARKKKLNAREEQLPPKVPPTDYHRFIYKCHKCKLGFKRRGMLVNHLAKRHPGMGPEQVPELMLPILKTTKDFYCQYCYKTYKSSSKRKAHILKIHPGAELPVSSRGVRLPIGETTDQTSFSQTVGSVTMSPHACNWCHKQYASRAKLLQHQRKKHRELMPADTQTPKATLRPQGRRAARAAAAAAEREFTGEMSSASEDGNLTAITPMDTAVSGPAVVVAPAHTAVVPTPATLSAVSVAEVTLAAPVTAPMGTPMSVVAAPVAVATTEFHAGQPLIVQSAHPALIQETGQPLQLDQANLLGAGVELHSLDYRLCQPAGAGGPSGELCRVWTVHSTR